MIPLVCIFNSCKRHCRAHCIRISCLVKSFASRKLVFQADMLNNKQTLHLMSAYNTVYVAFLHSFSLSKLTTGVLSWTQGENVCCCSLSPNMLKGKPNSALPCDLTQTRITWDHFLDHSRRWREEEDAIMIFLRRSTNERVPITANMRWYWAVSPEEVYWHSHFHSLPWFVGQKFKHFA